MFSGWTDVWTDAQMDVMKLMHKLLLLPVGAKDTNNNNTLTNTVQACNFLNLSKPTVKKYTS